METIDEGEKAAILALLTSMLAFLPEDRCPLSQALNSEWMVRWARPELTKVRTTST